MKAIFTSSKKLLLILAFTLIYVGLVQNTPRAKAISGEATNTIPNNGSVILSPTDPWLVVTRPGTNGMNGPQSEVYAYWPVNDPSSPTITIIDACDTSLNDANPGNNVTAFNIYFVSSVTASAGTMTIANQIYGPVSQVQCTAGSNISMVLNPQNNSAINTDRLFLDGVEYYRVRIVGFLTNPSTAYYVNRYRVTISGANGLLGYAAENNPGDVNSYTGIAFDESSSNSWGWGTRIGFALPCTAAASVLESVRFYDTDHINAATSASPFWQNNTNPMRYTLDAFNRRTQVQDLALTQTGTLTGGNGVVDQTVTFNLRRDRIYVLTVYNINLVNSIQVQVPYDQVYSNDDCNTAPTVSSLSAVCTMTGSGPSVAISYNSQDVEGDPLTISLSAPQLWAGVKSETKAPGANVLTGSPFLTFSGLYGTVYTVSGTISDGALSNPFSDTYSCPAPVVSIDCTLAGVSPVSYEVGETITPVINITRAGTLFPATVSITSSTLTLNGAAQTRTTALPVNITAPSTTSSLAYQPRTFTDADLSVSSFSLIASFTYTGSGGLSGTVGCSNAGSLNPLVYSVVRKPFFKVSGGDLMVGAAYPTTSPTSCTGSTVGNVSSWATVNSATDRKGANVSAMSQILGTAKDFYSAGSTAPPSFPKKWLTIANNTGEWGSAYGQVSCMKDMYSSTKLSTTTPQPIAPATTYTPGVSPSTNNQFEFNGNLTINGALNFTSKLALYVTGDVYISSNITMNSTYTNGIVDIPFFALIVKGNIYVAPGVTQLDGMYVAQPNSLGAGGALYTCGSAYAQVLAANIFASCSNPLTFNGVVQAKSIKLLRANGSLSSNVPSETINLLPELYMAGAPFSDTNPSTSLFDSASNLSPLL